MVSNVHDRSLRHLLAILTKHLIPLTCITKLILRHKLPVEYATSKVSYLNPHATSSHRSLCLTSVSRWFIERRTDLASILSIFIPHLFVFFSPFCSEFLRCHRWAAFSSTHILRVTMQRWASITYFWGGVHSMSTACATAQLVMNWTMALASCPGHIIYYCCGVK
jgi:hypothetical protein